MSDIKNEIYIEKEEKKWNLDRLLEHKNRDKFNANFHKESISI